MKKLKKTKIKDNKENKKTRVEIFISRNKTFKVHNGEKIENK